MILKTGYWISFPLFKVDLGLFIAEKKNTLDRIQFALYPCISQQGGGKFLYQDTLDDG